MNRLVPRLAATLTVAFALLPSRVAAADCDLRLRGRVVDAENGAPVRDAHILAGAVTAHSGNDGSFSLEGLCPGSIRITLEHPLYHVAERDVSVPMSGIIELSALPLGEVIVIDKPKPIESTQTQTTLSGAELEATRGANLADAVDTVPGVRVLRSGGTAKPIIRGQFGRRLLILSDGIRHESQKWGVDHAPEVDPFSAGSITVVKGAAAVRYGADAVGGTILLEPSPLRVTPGLSGEAHLVGSSNARRGVAALRLDAAPAAVRGLAFRAEGSGLISAAPQTPDYPLDNLGARETNLGLSTGFGRDLYDVKTAFRRHQAQNGICTCFVNDSPDDFFAQLDSDRPRNSELYRSAYGIDRPYQDVTHDLAMARASYWLFPGQLTGTYAFQRDRRKEYDRVRDNVAGPQADFSLDTHTVDGTWEHEDTVDHVRIRHLVGLSFLSQDNRYRGLPLLPNYRNRSGAVHAMIEASRHGVTVEGGLRLDLLARETFLGEAAARRFENDALLPGDCTERAGDVTHCDRSYPMMSGSLGVAWATPGAGTLHLDLTSTARAPFADEQFINGTSPSSPVLAVGDPSLGVERTWGASMSWDLNREWLRTSAAVFANRVDDYIYFAPRLDDNGDLAFEVLVRGAFPVFENRAIDAHFYGGEASVSLAPRPWLGVIAQGAWVRGRNRSDEAYLVFVPPDRYSLEIEGTLPDQPRLRKASLAVNTTLVTRQKRFEIDADFDTPPAAYTLLGARVGAEADVLGQPVRFALVGRNLLNRRYRDYTSLLRYFADEPGLDLSLRLSTSW